MAEAEADAWENGGWGEISVNPVIPPNPPERKPLITGRGRGLRSHSEAQNPGSGAFTDLAALNAELPPSPTSPSPSGDGVQNDEKGLSRNERSLLNKILNTDLVEVYENDLEIYRAEPTHPLYSIKSFNQLGLNDNLFKGIANMGFTKPSTIQEKALPCLLGDPPQNMIAQSQSGTGKTATFLLTMLSKVDPTKDHCQCLCIAPTLELAAQISDVAKKMGRFMADISVGTAIRGGTLSLNQDGVLSDHLVIGTPGTLNNYAQGKKDGKLDLKKINVFVLDEADVLIEESGFLPITRRLRTKLNANCQILLFSATYDEDVMTFAREIVPNPVEIQVHRSQLALKNINQYYMELADHESKYKAIVNIYGVYAVGQSIIFCATKKEAAWLMNRMYNDGHEVILLSSDLTPEEREDAIRKFRRSECRCMISTNLSARGLDITQVNLVVNWDMPRLPGSKKADCETYLHRIGRSGRFGKMGIAINFVSGPGDHEMLKEIESHFEIKIEQISNSDASDLDKISSN